MSELENERHKNTDLKRSRNSWYQEWFKENERIAELEAENDRLREDKIDLINQIDNDERAEQAEAEVKRLTEDRASAYRAADKLLIERNCLQKENERLRVMEDDLPGRWQLGQKLVCSEEARTELKNSYAILMSRFKQEKAALASLLADNGLTTVWSDMRKAEREVEEWHERCHEMERQRDKYEWMLHEAVGMTNTDMALRLADLEKRWDMKHGDKYEQMLGRGLK